MTKEQTFNHINERKIDPKTGRLRKDVCFHIYKMKDNKGNISGYGLFCVIDGVKENLPLLASMDPSDLKDSYSYAVRKYV